MSPQLIQVLDENTANQIAAGEVVERPASVVKELVENSLDAYSRNIEIAIVDGGIELIRVTDDGTGMSPTDASLAVLRHATSKIRSAEDLYGVNSLGFRGEALPSIASVSKFTLTSRLHDEQLATYVEVAGGTVTDTREAGGGVGTVITVADLFYNTPARRKFLKTSATEGGYIHDIVGKLALSHPEVSFKLFNNSRLVLATPGNGDLVETMISLYGSKIKPELLPIRYEEDSLILSGFVAKPTLLKSSRQWQTFIVNSRIVSSRALTKALDNAYHSLLPKAGYPLAVLRFTLPPETIDVNVHPQKSEIKFDNEGRIFKALHRAVTDALTSSPDRIYSMTPESNAPQIAYTAPPSSFTPTRPTSTEYQRGSNTAPPRSFSQAAAPQNEQPAWREEPLPFEAVRQMFRREEVVVTEEPEAAETAKEPLIALGQIAACYIVASGPDGLYVVDQHAAHERILYDRLSASSGRIPVQTLLMPVFLDFDSREAELIVSHLPVFYELGFTVEQVGPETFRVVEMPADIAPGDARDFIQDMLRQLQDMSEPTAAALRHSVLQMAACRAAIKAGANLNMRQLQALLSELAATSLPYTCPHGRPTIVKFTPDELGRLFKRS